MKRWMRLVLEVIRKELRDLIRFIVHGEKRRDVITHLEDPVTKIVYGVGADIGEDYEDYKLKVERYLKDYSETVVIHKLRTNKPMTKMNLRSLSISLRTSLAMLRIMQELMGIPHTDCLSAS